MRENEPSEIPGAVARELWRNIKGGYVLLVAIVGMWSLASHFLSEGTLALIVNVVFLFISVVWGQPDGAFILRSLAGRHHETRVAQP